MGAAEVAVLLTTLAIALISVLAAVVPMVFTAIVLFFVVRRLMRGGGVVVMGPSVQLGNMLASSAASRPSAPPQPKVDFVKRAQCRACASPKVQRSLSAYVYCDYCAELMDWDFQACLADKRSKLPGPTYEALLRRVQPKLDAAKAAGDLDTYRELQRQIFDGYAQACPAALSPRIGDPRYREAYVAFAADSAALGDFDPDCAAAFDAQQATVARLAWDRSNPLSPRVRSHTFWPMLEAVMHSSRLRCEIAEREGLIDSHPDRPPIDILVNNAVSAMVQGWMPYLSDEDKERLLDETGLRDHYQKVEPFDATEGGCPSCSAPITAVAGAKRVLCYQCGHMVGMGAGSLNCHGCAAPVEIPVDTRLFECPYCDAELRLMG